MKKTWSEMQWLITNPLTLMPASPPRISYEDQPAIDNGGVLRQFYSDLIEGLAGGKLMLLFEGDSNRKVPSYQPQAVMSV